MRNYLIIVEGAHDIAVMEKLLRLNGVGERIRNEKDLPEVWKHTIPETFPFQEGRLDRITPIPSFLKNEEVSVAIKNASSDTEIMVVLQQILDTMLVREKDHLNGVMLLCDADQKKAQPKMQAIVESFEEKDDFKITINESKITLNLEIKEIPIYTFVFPDDENEGNLENLLLETAKVVYPELLKLAEEYVNQAAVIQKKLLKEQYAKKAKVGCIANAMKPGKANQVSIADDAWISEKTLEVCEMLQKLNSKLRKMIAE